MSGRSGAAHPAGTLDEELLGAVARAVLTATAQDRLEALTLPYPRDLQVVADRITLRCLRYGVPPPGSVPELLTWCAQPLADWPIPGSVPPSVLPGTRLIDPVGRTATRSCAELAALGHPAGPEVEAEAAVRGLRTELGPQRYRECMRFLVEHPVVSADLRWRRHWNVALWTRVKHLYGEVPKSLQDEDRLRICGSCTLPGRRPGSAARWCEGERCGPETEFSELRKPGAAVLLDRSLRLFVTLPGNHERSVLTLMSEAGVTCTRLPADRSSFELATSAGPPITALVVDRAQPRLWADRVPWSELPVRDGLLVIVPETRTEPAYARELRAAVHSGCGVRPVLLTAKRAVRHLISPPPRRAPSSGRT
ncbi:MULTISPECIES: HU-CCDC81 and SPOR domain-containing protein [Streptomyces]|uniref:pPIWI_RE_Y domain-containing protein n=1 Tax=Streptomyces TaxID=1883 RepID=UPI000F79F979|nr:MULTISPECIES: HU-CCDC81 and SPOR domain-containing protein [Streptomyces]RST00391.1 hypothetical protein EF910_32160 [Streptomyces sp. WAC07149]GLX23892.1 hypothetical protein Slala01_75360 [Streptomyces lavendulae subsp. lavendulae]GLX31659.1 hypothetical protein Slala02_74780 [Streptomyces lavendulae subsp. lavendulae]